MGLRERFSRDGPSRLADAELVALVLGTAAGGRSPLAIAAELLDQHDGLHGLQRAEPASLARVVGVGPARAVRLLAGLQAGVRGACRAPDPGHAVTTADRAAALLGPGLWPLGCEELHGLFLDRRRRLLALRTLTRGSDAFTVVDPRQIYRVAVQLGASAVILGHNHPSGDLTPSHQDRAVTARVVRAGSTLGLPLLDHLILAAGGYCSLAEQGEIEGYRPDPVGRTG